MKRRFLVASLTTILLSSVIFVVIFRYSSSRRTSDHLTELYGVELELALNHYFSIRHTTVADTYEQAKIYCSKVATSYELFRCIAARMEPFDINPNEVVRIRVIDYQEDCAVAMAIYTTVGSTYPNSFLFKKEDEVWKIASRGDALDEFNKSNPQIPFGCS